MSIVKTLLSLALAAQACDPFSTGNPVDNSKPYPQKKDLPTWNINGHIIYAKDEKTAIKYVKKRGLYTEDK